MNNEQRSDFILSAMVLAGIIIVASSGFYFSDPPEKPIESTRNSVLTCTVKSNIDGVITLNDDCKITVIGE